MSAPPPHPFALPGEDHALSPYTGFVRAHWEATADGMLAALTPYATDGRALYHLPGARPSFSGRRSDGLEGYARTLLLAALRVAGAGADPAGLLERYAQGLAAGTRRPGGDGPEDWPVISGRGQPMVEAASIALALRLTRPWLWDRLDDATRQRAADWLGAALREPPWENNWVLFPMTVGGFLAEIGVEAEAARAARSRGLERIEEWYRGDGWYSDGPQRCFDYYNGWAMHLYPVVEAWLAGESDLLERYGRRLSAHLADYARLFGGDGAPVHQGRSLTYRMATAAPLWLGALTGHTPLAPGLTRRLASGALRYFLDRGAAADGGLLSLGWHGPYPGMLQGYSGPASPYWGSKGFLGLLLPPGHPVWNVPEEPAPAERADATTPVPAPNWLLQSTAADGLVRLHNHGSEDARYDAYYARLAYSTVTGPVGEQGPPDNHVGLVTGAATDDNGGIAPRRAVEPLGSGPGWAASRSRSGDAHLVTVVLAHGAVEVRVHLVTGAAAGSRVRHTGWATPPEGRLRSELLPRHGLTPMPALPPRPTAFSPGATTPVLQGTTTGAADGDLHVSLARLTGEPDPPPLVEAVRTAVGRHRGAHEVLVSFRGGPTRRVRLTADHVEVGAGDTEAPGSDPREGD